MRRILASLLVGVVCLLHSRVTQGEEGSPLRVSPLQVGITETHQLAPKDWDIWGLRLGLPKTYNDHANGIDIGWDNRAKQSWLLIELGVNNHVVEGSAIQVGLGNSLSRGCADRRVGAGLQLGVIQNVLAGYGIQAGGCNYNSGKHGGGIQAGCIFNDTEAFNGIQLAGFECSALDFSGLQASGFDCSATKFTGVQMGGCPSCSNDFGGIQVGWLASQAGEMEGVQVGGLECTADNVEGLQIAGGGSIAKDFTGLQAAGFACRADDSGGIQVAGAFCGADDFVGFQIAGLECDAQNVRGIQASAPLLIGGNEAKHLHGLQIGLGLIPRRIRLTVPTNSQPAAATSEAQAQKDLAKKEKSFFANNYAETLDGLQIGLLLNQADEVHGLQISLLYNEAAELSGLQLGLVNVAAKMTGVQIGLLNFIDTSSCSRMPLINAHF